MTEQEWLHCTNPERMLEFLGDRPSLEEGVPGPELSDALARKVRLFACACCRRTWHLLNTRRSRRAVEVAERFADRQASHFALVSACLATLFHWPPDHPGHIPAGAVSLSGFTRATCGGDVAISARSAAEALRRTTPGDPEAVYKAESALQAVLLRDIVGNPFRPVPFDPAWRTPQVVAHALAAYEQRHLPEGTLDATRLAQLADTLEEAGCTVAEILDHCRSPGTHVRACWLLDLLLGKE